MISVVIPLYNGAAYIERSIHSVLSQTFLPAEIIVIDDGSKDNGPDIVAQMSHPTIRLIRQANAGVSAARNKGISEARYEYIAFLDADDEWLPHHLETIARLIGKYPQCGVFGASYYFAQKGKEYTTPILPPFFTFTEEEGVIDNYYEMASGTDFPINMNSFAVRKKEIEKVGGFPVGVLTGEDLVTIAKLHINCDFAYSKRPSSIYHLTGGEGKIIRPILYTNPLDKMFDDLLTSAAHRKGVRRYVSAWHKRRMTGALLNHHYRLACREFLISFRLMPIQKKLYTSLLVALYASVTGKSMIAINQKLKKNKS